MPCPQNTVPSANASAALQPGGRGGGQAAVGYSIELCPAGVVAAVRPVRATRRPEGKRQTPGNIRVMTVLSTAGRRTCGVYNVLRFSRRELPRRLKQGSVSASGIRGGGCCAKRLASG